MYDYYKKDDSFDVESQSDEVKKRYGLHYNFSAVAGDYDPYVQNLGSDYNILSQDIEGQTNNSLCPEGWHIPTSFTHGVFGNYYADMEYIDYIFVFFFYVYIVEKSVGHIIKLFVGKIYEFRDFRTYVFNDFVRSHKETWSRMNFPQGA